MKKVVGAAVAVMFAATFLAGSLTTTAASAASPSRSGLVVTTVTVEVSSAHVVAGDDVTISGRISPSTPAGRDVYLVIHAGNGYRILSRSTTDSTGAYSMPVPTDWYDAHQLLVVATPTSTAAAGYSDTVRVGVRPPYDPHGDSTAWRLEARQTRWDPCHVVPYVTNLRIAPAGTLKTVNRAFRLLHAATGITFRRAGATAKVPFSETTRANQFPVHGLVVAWTTPRVVPELRGDIVGLGGSTSRSLDGGPQQYVYGGVAIDATQPLSVKGFGPGQSIGVLLLHELAHAVGLSHVKQQDQVMFPSLQRTARGRFEAGDLAGLHKLGAARGCI